jgi:hypothetical protein
MPVALTRRWTAWRIYFLELCHLWGTKNFEGKQRFQRAIFTYGLKSSDPEGLGMAPNFFSQ